MGSEDRISSLPDHLLHHILSFLHTQKSVSTSVLSRRWQRVWIGLPTLAFDDKRGSTAGFADLVDEVLAHRHQGTVDRLEIYVRHPPHIARANEWLQLAADRVRENISIVFHENLPAEKIVQDIGNDYDQIVLDLPCGGRTTAMTLDFHVIGIATLVIPPAVPSSLTQLELKFLRVDARSLSNFVSTCCPHLRKLVVHTFGDMVVLKLSNNVLEDLEIHFNFGGLRRLEVCSRNLRRLRIIRVFPREVMAHEVHDGSKLASFFTPRLEDLCWKTSSTVHPSRIDFAHSLSTVRQLEVGLETHAMVHHTRLNRNKLALWLLRRCRHIRCLKVYLCNLLPDSWLAQYEDLMVAVPHLSTVTDLTVSTILSHHAYGSSITTLLSRCSHVETLTILVQDERHEDAYTCEITAACWCKFPADWKDQTLCLDFLRQVDLKGFTMAYWLPDLVSVLCRSRPAVLINYSD